MEGRITAVVCDDAPGFRALLATVLANAGADVVGRGATWPEAEALAGSAEVVVVDLWMPDLDLDALARVRGLATDAWVVVVTALDVEEARRRVAGLGVDLVLSKLAPPDELARSILDVARSPSA